MQLKTTISKTKENHLYDPSSRFFMTGSCFTENIGHILGKYKFMVSANPLGIYYNPISIARFILHYLSEERIPLSEEMWDIRDIISHRDFHSSNNQLNLQTYTEKITEKLKRASASWQAANEVILTLGTAWVYYENKSDRIVANCHKKPAKNFTKKLLSTNEIVDNLSQVISRFPQKHFLLTVSPVRHLKEGLVANSRSKSILIESCHVLCEKFENVLYFPAYEIMLDDLRDYRFYKSDLIHPTDMAIDYIWNHFVSTMMSESARNFISEMDKLLNAVNHRPFNPLSHEYQKFCKKYLEYAETLRQRYPHLDLEKEKIHLQNQLL